MEPNQDTSQLDNSVVALMHGIKANEGMNGNYNGMADKNSNGDYTAAGIGSWGNYDANGKLKALNQGDIPSKFQDDAKQYGLDSSDFSAENQNRVMYSRLLAEKQSGLQPEQILSKWNSGDPNKYQNQATSTGNGPVGGYDVSSYVKKGMTAAQEYSQQNGQSQGQKMLAPGVPALTISNPQTQNQSQGQDKGFLSNLFSGNIGGAAKNAMDFAFPIIGDGINDIQGTNKKTLLQQLGDAGLSALWFIPGLGEAGLAAKVLEGGAVGYGAGALSQLSQGKDIGSSFSPNTTNLLGAATGGIAGGVLSKLSSLLGRNITEKGALDAVQGNLEDAMNATKSGANLLKDLKTAGHDPMGLAVRENAIPDIVNNQFDSTAAKKIVQKNNSELGSLRAGILDTSGVRGSLPMLKNEILDTINSTMSGTARDHALDLTNKEFDTLIGQYGKQPSATAMETVKEYLQGRGNYEMATPSITTNAYRTMADAAKTQMEKIAEKSGVPNMGELNKLMSSHYATLDALDKINGQRVAGGRLGNILRGHTMAGVGAMAGNAFGGGFLGTVAGAVGGEGANTVISKILGETSFTNPIREAVTKRIETQNPEIVQKIQEALANKGRLSSSLMGKIAPQLAPKSGSKIAGLVPRTLTVGATRASPGLISRSR